jgi:hypothetical protein
MAFSVHGAIGGGAQRSGGHVGLRRHQGHGSVVLRRWGDVKWWWRELLLLHVVSGCSGVVVAVRRWRWVEATVW